MNIRELSKGLGVDVIVFDAHVPLTRIQSDSKRIKPGDVFFPKKGAQVDAISFAKEAVAKGAGAIVTQEKLELAINQIIMPRDRASLKILCGYFYPQATHAIDVIGVTGTNGKTSVCHFIEALFEAGGVETGYLGTTEYRWKDHVFPAKLTTPQYEDLQYHCHQMRSHDVNAVVMECSSHGIELGRIDDIGFDVCVFTNLTHEHLDFHQDMQDYAKAKAKLFHIYLNQSIKDKKLAIINIDDPVGAQWVEARIFKDICTFGFDTRADIHAVSYQTTPKGMDVTLSVFQTRYHIHMPMLGLYNVSNMMAAIAVGHWKGLDMDPMIQTIEAGIDVPGRLQRVNIDAPFSVIVDYAYTEDALKNVLGTLKPFCKSTLIVVFGCGGDRDATRRPKMAKAVFALADLMIVTTDNPRFEDPDAIIDEILTGIAHEDGFEKKVIRLADRAQAIEKALSVAQPGDMVVIAGKGHETYQEIKGVRYPFNDIDVVETYWEQI